MQFPRYGVVYLKGIAMGAADIVPGVSGGTIAFITGIYDELLNAIRAVNPIALKILWQQGVAAFWQHINGYFLLSLVAGIATSFLLLAHAITWAMQDYPLLLWSFIFGLVLASGIHIGKMINIRSGSVWLLFILGFIASFSITTLKPAEVDPGYLMIFLAGAIAVCAMILPGISGSFILLLMGLYGYMIQAIKTLDMPVIALFIAGCICGLLLFAHLVSWLLHTYRHQTLAFLTGMLFASLNAVWPWRVVLEYYQSGDKLKPLLQKNILPQQYQLLTGGDPMLLYCVLLAFFGLVLVLFLERLTDNKP